MARTYPGDRTLQAESHTPVIVQDIPTSGFITNTGLGAVLKAEVQMTSITGGVATVLYSLNTGATYVEWKKLQSVSAQAFSGTLSLPLSVSQEWSAVVVAVTARGGFGGSAVSRVTDWYIDSPTSFFSRQVIEAV
jgi:hypothetical protein